MPRTSKTLLINARSAVAAFKKSPMAVSHALLACSLVGAVSVLPSSATAAERQPLDGVVAVVDDQIILLSELEELRMVAAEQQPGLAGLPAEAQRKQLLERLIDDKVILAKARQDTTLRVSEKEIAPRVEEAIARYVEQQGGEQKFETLLKQTNGMSIGQFRARLTQQYMEQSYRQKLQFKYVGDQEPSQSQVREFYAKYKDSLPVQQNGIRLSHIQVKVKPGRELERGALLKADSLIKELGKGAGFADLAKKHSDDYSAKDGGDLGYTKRGTLDADYERAAFSLDAGDYTRIPVRTRFGYHVIRVTGKKDNEVRTSHILLRLTPQASDSARTRDFLDSLRTAALKKEGGFAALARAHSEDKKTRDLGGSLGWFTRDQLDARYLAAVDTLQEGGISGPIAIGDSYHIFRLDGRSAERKLTLKDDFAEISQIARSWLLSQKLSGYVKKWRETIHVEDRLAQFKNLPSDEEPAQEDIPFGPAPAPN